MPVREWPTTVKRIVLADSYSESIGSIIKRSQPTSGPALVRRSAGQVPDILNSTLLFLTYDDYLIFVDWFNNVEEGLAGGLYCLNWVHPLTSQPCKVRIVPQDGSIALSGAPYKDTAYAWAVSVKLEVLP